MNNKISSIHLLLAFVGILALIGPTHILSNGAYAQTNSSSVDVNPNINAEKFRYQNYDFGQ